MRMSDWMLRKRKEGVEEKTAPMPICSALGRIFVDNNLLYTTNPLSQIGEN